jgi:DNA-binding response OmpR family regulator
VKARKEKKGMRQERETAEVLPTELLATVGQEFRGPLTTIQGDATTLLRHGHHLTLEEREEFLHAISEASAHLGKLVDRFLELAQLETHAHAFTPETVNLLAFVQESMLATQQSHSHHRLLVPDLVLLDVMMPRMDGFPVCQHVRAFSTVPILIMTARGQDQDQVKGLDLGVDDDLTRPLSGEELLARVRAVLRRTQLRSDEATPGRATTVTIGELTIDYAQHLVTLVGQEVTLTPTEYRLLAYLAQNVGRVLTQDLLLEHVWGADYVGESQMLQVNVNRLRRKLEADPAHPQYLKTKVGIGYLLVAPSVSNGPS